MKIILRDVRRKKGITQRELAAISGVTRQTIIRIENSSDIEVRLSTLVLLADSLKCQLSDLLCE